MFDFPFAIFSNDIPVAYRSENTQDGPTKLLKSWKIVVEDHKFDFLFPIEAMKAAATTFNRILPHTKGKLTNLRHQKRATPSCPPKRGADAGVDDLATSPLSHIATEPCIHIAT